MTSKLNKSMTIGGIVVVLIGLLVWQAIRMTRPRQYTLENATITRLDLATREGEIEFVHPKSGRTIPVTGQIPPDCPITIDGKPADLADVRVGDKVSVCGLIYVDYSLKPLWVHVTRTGATSQPTTSPAANVP